MRPSPYVSLPNEIANVWSKTFLPACPGSIFDTMQKKRERGEHKPFFDPGMGLDIAMAIESIEKAQKADAQDNILFIYAHDASLINVGDVFPKTANEWQKAGWRDKMFWAFLEDFKSAYKSYL